MQFLTGCYLNMQETLAFGGFWRCRTPLHPSLNSPSVVLLLQRVRTFPLKCANCCMVIRHTCTEFSSRLKTKLCTSCISVTADVSRSSSDRRIQSFSTCRAITIL